VLLRDLPVLLPVGRDRARGDRVDPDLGREVAGQRGGEGAHAALGGAVGDGDRVDHVLLVDAVAVGAGEIDDRAVAGRAQVRQRRLADAEGAEQVDVEQGGERVRVGLGEAHRVGRVDPAGGVDDDVDPAVALDHVGDEGSDGGRLGHLELRRVPLRTGGLDLGQRLARGGLRAAVPERHGRALAAQRPRHRAAQRAAGAGHDRDPLPEALTVVPACHQTSLPKIEVLRQPARV